MLSSHHPFHIILFAFALHASAGSFAREIRTDSLLSVYDRLVDQAAVYIDARQASIDSCRQLLSIPSNEGRGGEIFLQIAELYCPYRSDSALYYYNLAAGDPNNNLACMAAIRRIRLLATIGNYDIAFAEKDRLHIIPFDCRVAYYDALYRLYSEAAMAAKIDTYQQLYWAQAHTYTDSLIAFCDAYGLRPYAYWRQRISRANVKKESYTALAYTDSAMSRLTPREHEYAIFAFERAVIYRDLGDMQAYYRWLIRSAITDVLCGITDNGSSWMIAMEAYNHGDLDRADKYINYSVGNADIFNATTRYQQIAPYALIISHTNERVQQRFNIRLWTAVFILVIGIIGIIIAVVLISQRNKKLDALNHQLLLLNSQLEESNMVKEQYICRYLEVYSGMIDRMMHMARKTEKDPDAFFRKEMQAFYRDFDQTFLSLYPTFINDFNALLTPEARIVPKQGDMLTTELRIFALVRLGIDASAKIAQLLHFAPNTIYNYRAQIRNAAIGSKDDFERLVRLIGRHNI